MMPEMIDNNEAVSRRALLKTAAAGAGMLIALPALTKAALADDPTPPAPPAKPAEVWKDAGAAADFKASVPNRVDFGVCVAWVTRVDDQKFEAVSAKCTHRGCELGYDAQTTQDLVCPCHGGTFKLDGTNVAGTTHNPAKPLPNLTVLTTQVKDGRVQVNIAPAM